MRALLEESFRAAVAAADPLKILGAHLPAPPKGRTFVAAAGKAQLVGSAMVKPGACVVDVGIHRRADGKLVGDVDFDAVKDVAGWITPVPGGVGPMTVAMMVANTIRATELALGQDAAG